MSYKNTMKLIASNFSLVWKQVLYFIVCFIILFICTYEVAKPIINIFVEDGVSGEVGNLVDSIYTMQNSAYFSFFDILKHISNLIFVNFKEIYLNLILVIIFGLLLPFIVFQVSVYNLCSIIYKKLSMNMSVGYFSNLLSTFKSSILYALTNVVLSLPFWALKLLFLEIYLTISINNIFISYVGMVLLSGLWIFIDSMKIAIFSCYSGHSVEFDYSPLKTFSNSVPLTIKNFLNILSNSVILELTIIVATGFIALFTFFAGLVLVIPAGFVLTSIFYIVVYLNKSGQRYYLNNNFIFNPVKYTIKQDEFVSVNIPEEPVEEQVVTTILSKNIKKKKHKHKKKNNKS